MMHEKLRQKRARIQAAASDFELLVRVVNVDHDHVWTGRKKLLASKQGPGPTLP